MIRLADKARTRLVEEAEKARPEEACGVLGGRVAGGSGGGSGDGSGGGSGGAAGEGADGDWEVSRVLPCRNADERPKWRYTLDPTDQLDAFRTLDDAGLDLVGFYHSHPRGPRGPSETDLDRATWPGHIYLIVSLDGEEPWLGAWLYTRDQAFDAVPLEVAGT